MRRAGLQRLVDGDIALRVDLDAQPSARGRLCSDAGRPRAAHATYDFRFASRAIDADRDVGATRLELDALRN